MTKKVTIEELGVDLKRRIDEVKESELNLEKKKLSLTDRERRVKYREEKVSDREKIIRRHRYNG